MGMHTKEHNIFYFKIEDIVFSHLCFDSKFFNPVLVTWLNFFFVKPSIFHMVETMTAILMPMYTMAKQSDFLSETSLSLSYGILDLKMSRCSYRPLFDVYNELSSLLGKV